MRGGEIFVPKIPTRCSIIDLARADGAGVARSKVVGIRPGEKLHEIMVTEDDSRQTLEMDDRYVIEPAFQFWQREPYIEHGATPVPTGFATVQTAMSIG